MTGTIGSYKCNTLYILITIVESSSEKYMLGIKFCLHTSSLAARLMPVGIDAVRALATRWVHVCTLHTDYIASSFSVCWVELMLSVSVEV